MQDQIGTAAGQIWKLLAEKGPISINDVPRLAKQSTQIAYQGLGWLAREGKVTYQTKGQKTTVSLVTSECYC